MHHILIIFFFFPLLFYFLGKPSLAAFIDWEQWIRAVFFFACVWGVGGSITETGREVFDTCIRGTIDGILLPSSERFE
jgi:hypothetical protein